MTGALGNPLGASSLSAANAQRRFAMWIVRNQITRNDLCRYFRFGPHETEESPLATAYAIMLLDGEYPDVADRLADGLIRLQERYAANRHVGGGVPSIANDSSLLFYSSDALAAVKALMTAYRRSGNAANLRAARGFSEFVQRMSDGERDGFLAENVGFPMQYATPGGAIQNWLVPNVSMLFWDALDDYAAVAHDESAAKLFARGRSFLLRSTQAPNGAYFDHYEPGFPARSYSDQRWRWFKTERDGRHVAIGDNMMMSALGAQRLGDQRAVDRFLRWTKPQNGAFYAYIDVDTGGSGFESGDVPYYDVVCSGMYCELLRRSGRLTDDDRVALERIFAISSGGDGGYRWGLKGDGGWVQDSAEALVTGYWVAQK